MGEALGGSANHNKQRRKGLSSAGLSMPETCPGWGTGCMYLLLLVNDIVKVGLPQWHCTVESSTCRIPVVLVHTNFNNAGLEAWAVRGCSNTTLASTESGTCCSTSASHLKAPGKPFKGQLLGLECWAMCFPMLLDKRQVRVPLNRRILTTPSRRLRYLPTMRQASKQNRYRTVGTMGQGSRTQRLIGTYAALKLLTEAAGYPATSGCPS